MNLDDLDKMLDCGDGSCRFAIHRGGMRTQGGCRCLGDRGGARLGVAGALASYVTAARAMRAEVATLRARVAELEQEREYACQAPSDGCDCPGCQAADEAAKRGEL